MKLFIVVKIADNEIVECQAIYSIAKAFRVIISMIEHHLNRLLTTEKYNTLKKDKLLSFTVDNSYSYFLIREFPPTYWLKPD